MLLLFVSLFVLFLVHQFWYRRRHLPDGPIPLPGVGNLLAFYSKPRWEPILLKWRQKYGPLYTLWTGGRPAITVNTYDAAQKLFVQQGDAFADRGMPVKALILTRGGPYGIVFNSGSVWSDQRRFALHTLRNFGLGKNQMQERILEEVAYVIENISSDVATGTDEIDAYKHTDLAVGSVLNSVLCGYRFTANDKAHEFVDMKEKTASFFASLADPLFQMSMNYKVLLKIPFFQRRFDRILWPQREIFRFIDGIIKEHERTTDYTVEFEPRDFIDAYLIHKQNNDSTGEEHSFSREQLLGSVVDMWFAGQETTSATITWCLGYLIQNPEAQKKMHDELDAVIGSDRLITVADRQSLPYCNAVIMETQRVSNVFALNLPRKTNRDVQYDDMVIPSGTVVVPQISVILWDPDLYPNPEHFDPDRFIDENGQLKKAEEFVPFSLGKRACLGESLAKMSIYLFVANLLNQFEFSAAHLPPTLLKAHSGMSIACQNYQCKIKKRH
ncbi:hypothetical protein M3Y94_01249600 [Aphelenchoides besseyi]|nr:hypothetical protein M3Y94_01249600 [Aphelenchoides besseyi]KAI6219398.1 Unspecific monooxygenase [Aphelenchoides besseyi]